MKLGRLIGAAVFALVVFAVAQADASPVNYAFAGTFPQPVFGSTQFSGTFTYDTNLPPYPGAAWTATIHYYAGADGTPINMSLNLGTDGTNPLGTPVNSELVVTHSPSYDELNLDLTYRSATGQTTFATIGMLNNNGLNNGPFTSLDPPSSLKLSEFNMGNQLILRTYDGSLGTVVGTITSLTAVVPEPATLAIFAFLAAGVACRGVRTGRAGVQSTEARRV
jgi:hypothetical protein